MLKSRSLQTPFNLKELFKRDIYRQQKQNITAVKVYFRVATFGQAF